MLNSVYDSTDRLREMRTRGREGVKNPENFAYVLNGSPLRIFLYLAKSVLPRRMFVMTISTKIGIFITKTYSVTNNPIFASCRHYKSLIDVINYSL